MIQRFAEAAAAFGILGARPKKGETAPVGNSVFLGLVGAL